MVSREIRVTPRGMRWPSASSLTLVGDAAHLMPPVGEGANQALRDAADLAAEVIASPGDAPGAIARYETQMRARMTACRTRSSAGAPRSLPERHGSPPPGRRCATCLRSNSPPSFSVAAGS